MPRHGFPQVLEYLRRTFVRGVQRDVPCPDAGHMTGSSYGLAFGKSCWDGFSYYTITDSRTGLTEYGGRTLRFRIADCNPSIHTCWEARSFPISRVVSSSITPEKLCDIGLTADIAAFVPCIGILFLIENQELAHRSTDTGAKPSIDAPRITATSTRLFGIVQLGRGVSRRGFGDLPCTERENWDHTGVSWDTCWRRSVSSDIRWQKNFGHFPRR